MVNKILIIGLGNEYISDDAVGILTVRELQQKFVSNNELPFRFDIKFEEASIGGLGLIDYITGYDVCVIIDAFYTQQKKVGTLYRYVQRTDNEIKNIKSSHQINLSQVLLLGKLLNIKIPSLVIVYGIEVKDILTFSENCTPDVSKAIKNLVALIYNDLVNLSVEKISDEMLSIYYEEELK